MKAFNASIFTEQTQASLKEDAYKLIEQNPANIRSILEYEDDAIVMEMNARRDYYISLLESQRQGLGIIDESVSSKLIAAIIAGAIAIVGAVIAMITGKGSSKASSGSSSGDSTTIFSVKDADKVLSDALDRVSDKDEAKEKAFDMAKNPPDDVEDATKQLDRLLGKGRGRGGFHNIDRSYDSSLPTQNPNHMIDAYRKSRTIVFNFYWQKVGSINGVPVESIKRIAENTNVHITNYILPSFDVIGGNLKTVDDIIAVGNDIKRTFYDLFEYSPEFVKDNIDDRISKIKSDLDDIKGNIEAINTGSEEEIDINAAKYLSSHPVWFDGIEDNGVNIKNPKCFNKVYDLKNILKMIMNYANDINPEKTDVDKLDKAKNLALAYRQAVVSIMNKVSMAYKQYYRMAIADFKQMQKVSINLSQLGNKSESFIYESEYYQQSGILQEYMFGRDTTDYIDFLDEYSSAIDDTSSRLSIYVHENQLRAINEEALIFSETGISDSEKFDRLYAVNEALNNKIKRGYYNAIAALKEIFRKFMEKLTANFGTTKAYLDRYKNIILKSNFNPQDVYKTQDLRRGIANVINADCPAMDFNQINTEEADDPVKFFNKFVRPRLQQVDMQKDKMPSEDGGIGAINEFFKSYFCMTNHEVEINGGQFQQNINDYFEFLYDIRKINNSIKKSLRSIDDTATKVMKQAGIDVNKPEPSGTPNSEGVVYSYLYQKWFTLNEDGILIEAEKVQSGDSPTQNQTKYGAGNIKNVEDKAEGSDDTNAIKGTERSTIDKRVHTYVNVCSSMLKAKMSACEFIRNECMQIIRDHVKRYVGNTAANKTNQQG